MASGGELFSRIYADRGAPVGDSARFRLRLFGYLRALPNLEWSDISDHLLREGGIHVTASTSAFMQFYESGQLADVLDSITIERRRLIAQIPPQGYPLRDHYMRRALAWDEFVKRAFREENLGYRLGDDGSVRYFVDEEFERNRVSALAALDFKPLHAARDEFLAAHRYIDPGSRDTKASVRAAFEALEILAKQLYADIDRLTKNVILQRMRVDMKALAPDEVASKAVAAVFDGLADIIDGAHEYRHGQRVEELTAPPLDYAVFFLSNVAATIRYLVPLWQAKQAATR